MSEIYVENVGKIDRFTIPIADEGGITVIRGENDIGKSILIRCVAAIAGEKIRLSVRDNQPQGLIEGLGVRITVGGRQLSAGELEAETLSGKFSVAELVDPRLKTEAAAAAARIKALLSVTEVHADPTLFYGPCGGKELFQEHVKPDRLKDADLVEMARRVREDFHDAARAAEGRSETCYSRAAGLRESIHGLDLEAPHDEEQLRKAREDAVRGEDRITAKRDECDRALKQIEEDEQTLEQLGASLPDLRAKDARLENAIGKAEEEAERVAAAAQEVARLEAELAKAKQTHAAAVEAKDRADQDVAAARESHTDAAAEHERFAAIRERINRRDQWQRERPTDQALEAAKARAVRAREAESRGVEIRRALEVKRKISEAEAEGQEAKIEAERLRDAAVSTDTVLSNAVKSPKFRVVNGELVVATERGENTPYRELSDGIRWKLALEEAARTLRKFSKSQLALLPVPQEAWDGLSNRNRGLIARYCKHFRISAVTAQADAGDLRAEIYAC